MILIFCSLIMLLLIVKSPKASCLSKLINIVSVIIIVMLTFFVFLLSPTQWADPTQFDDDACDVIRVSALLEIMISTSLIIRNLKNKRIPFFLFILFMMNIYTVYKVICTFVIP